MKRLKKRPMRRARRIVAKLHGKGDYLSSHAQHGDWFQSGADDFDNGVDKQFVDQSSEHFWLLPSFFIWVAYIAIFAVAILRRG
jgi:hypothetical protein